MGALAIPGVAAAHSGHGRGIGSGDYTVSLDPVPHDPAADNGSNVTGAAWLDQRGRNVDVRIVATGLDALPHAMHIHGLDHPEVAMCPGVDRRDDLVDDGLIETAEGLPDYGPIKVSLTTTGDTSPASALDLTRFPSGSALGVMTYQRRIKLPLDVAQRLGDMEIVIHGEDLNDNGMYDGRTTVLGAPLEAELPVACGHIVG